MKFLADGMLGKLTRWLRILGQDVTYSTEFSDNELLELAKKDTRALLTKDLQLYKRAIARGLDAFFVEGETEVERLAEISKRYSMPLEVDMDRSHCPVCNGELRVVTKELVADELEKNTYVHHDKFWKCINCGQIYWQGSHWKQITKMLVEAQRKQRCL